MRPRSLLGLVLLMAQGFAACRSSATVSPYQPARVADVALSRAPFREVHAAFKDRLDQAYVCIEVLGSYTLAGRKIPDLEGMLKDQGLRPSGPPFALFFDDPGSVPVERLRARVCFPVEDAGSSVKEPLRQDVLPGGTVAYALAGGPYPEVPLCYPGLLEYVRKMHWVVAGPIREIYLVPPQSVRDWAELRCEVQIPVAMAP